MGNDFWFSVYVTAVNANFGKCTLYGAVSTCPYCVDGGIQSFRNDACVYDIFIADIENIMSPLGSQC